MFPYPYPDQAIPGLELRTIWWANSCYQLWVAELPKLQSSTSCSHDHQDEPLMMRSTKNLRNPCLFSSMELFQKEKHRFSCDEMASHSLTCCLWRRKMLTRSFAMGELALEMTTNLTMLCEVVE